MIFPLENRADKKFSKESHALSILLLFIVVMDHMWYWMGNQVSQFQKKIKVLLQFGVCAKVWYAARRI